MSQTLLKRMGLDYHCEMRPVYISNNLSDYPTDFNGTFDTSNHRTYGCFKKNYRCVNPSDVINALYEVLPDYPLVEDSFIENMTKHKGHKLNEGAKYIIGIHLESRKIDYNNRAALGQDHIDNYLIIANAHDGGALKLGFKSKTYSCKNMFNALPCSYKHGKGVVHALQNGLKTALNSLETYKQEVIAMNEFNLSMKQVDELVDNINNNLFKSLKEEDVKTRTLNQVDALGNRITSEMYQKGRTAWGVMSGVTNFTTHETGRNVEASMYFGRRAEINKIAHNTVMEYINSYN